ncbi:MAG: hypothetical protein JW955_06595 [Sedimentisphaerales bacterium]|nr:hypothetical protein [Sedimentisphaerales bacterium]
MIHFDGRLYLCGETGERTYGLYAGDGSGCLARIPLGDGGWSEPQRFTKLAGSLFFIARNGFSWALWTLGRDGNPPRIVKDTLCSGDRPSVLSLTSLDGVLYFTVVPDASTRELWKLDAKAGPVRVARIGEPIAAPARFVPVAERMYFAVYERQRGYSLWTSDGQDAWRLGDFGDERPTNLTAMRARLYFTMPDGLWASDGTAEGTGLAAQVAIVTGDPNAPLAVLGERLVFAAEGSQTGVELWAGDGAPEGTGLVKDLQPGPESSSPANFIRNGRIAYFTTSAGPNEVVLWRTDGTAEGTLALASFSAPDYRPDPHSFVKLFDVHFLADGRLWRCTGDEVYLVEDEAIRDLSLLALTVVSDRLMLIADAGERGQALWTYAPEQQGIHHITAEDILAQRSAVLLGLLAQHWLDTETAIAGIATDASIPGK